MIRRPPRSTLFPYTTSSDLVSDVEPCLDPRTLEFSYVRGHLQGAQQKLDRKSTRLNSSHGYISYAVFCLKKKKIHLTDYLCAKQQHSTPNEPTVCTVYRALR